MATGDKIRQENITRITTAAEVVVMARAVVVVVGGSNKYFTSADPSGAFFTEEALLDPPNLCRTMPFNMSFSIASWETCFCNV